MSICKYCKHELTWKDRKPFHYVEDGTRIDDRFGNVVNYKAVAHTYEECTKIRLARKAAQAADRKAKGKAKRADTIARQKHNHAFQQSNYPVGSFIVYRKPQMWGEVDVYPVGKVIGHIPDSIRRASTGALKVELHPRQAFGNYSPYLGLGDYDNLIMAAELIAAAKDGELVRGMNFPDSRYYLVVSEKEYRSECRKVLRKIVRNSAPKAPAPWVQAFYPKIWTNVIKPKIERNKAWWAAKKAEDQDTKKPVDVLA